MEPIRAISFRQHFVELILRAEKKFEYSTTSTKIRERVYIYASLKPKDSKKVDKAPGELPAGVVMLL
jgi:hypothetical protein